MRVPRGLLQAKYSLPRLAAQFGEVQARKRIVFHAQAAAHQQCPQRRTATAYHWRDTQIMQTEVAGLIEAVDRQVRRHADLQRADGVQA